MPFNQSPRIPSQVITLAMPKSAKFTANTSIGGFCTNRWNRAKILKIYTSWKLTYRSDPSTVFHAQCISWRRLTQGVLLVAPHLGLVSPKNILGVWIGIFKPKSINIKTCIISKTTASIPTKFCWYKDHQMLFVGGPNVQTTNPRWPTAANFWKIAITQWQFDRSQKSDCLTGRQKIRKVTHIDSLILLAIKISNF